MNILAQLNQWALKITDTISTVQSDAGYTIKLDPQKTVLLANLLKTLLPQHYWFITYDYNNVHVLKRLDYEQGMTDPAMVELYLSLVPELIAIDDFAHWLVGNAPYTLYAARCIGAKYIQNQRENKNA